jgi:hypothetical protein
MAQTDPPNPFSVSTSAAMTTSCIPASRSPLKVFLRLERVPPIIKAYVHLVDLDGPL